MNDDGVIFFRDGVFTRDGEPFESPLTRAAAALVPPIGERFTAVGIYRVIEAAFTETINTPHTDEFTAAVDIEAVHQIERWGAEHDSGKNPWDWYWLIGHLGSKAVHAMLRRDFDKALHHCITIAATCKNWSLAIRSAKR